MDWKKEVVQRLRQLDAMRQAAQNLDTALQALTPQERLVVQMLFLYPEKGNVQRLCEMLHMEQSSVYRRRERALEKLAVALGVRDRQ